MKLEYEILINQYGQELINSEPLILIFDSLEVVAKRSFLNHIHFLIQQSKPKESDIDFAILASGLKPAYTPCVLLKKGVADYNLKKIIMLPDNELYKVFILFLNLFKIAYKRRFEVEKNNASKWWYWDLSDEINLGKLSKKNKIQ